MKKTDLLCFVLPTCDVDSMNEHLLPSLKNLGRLKAYASFGIIFQPPYTNEDMEKVIAEFDKLGLEYRYEYKEYEYEEETTDSSEE